MTAPWLPSTLRPFPDPNPTTLAIPSCVDGLIIEGHWNVDLLNSLFQKHSVQSILSIPLPQTFVSDRFVWSFCRDGKYTAASGYRLSHTLASQREGRKFGVELHDEHLWARLWSLNIQPKLRFFLWKIVHGILPTFDALQSRHLDVPSLCPVCNGADESITHLFISCVVAKQLSLLIDDTEFTNTTVNPVTYLRRMLQADLTKATRLIYFWWRLWKSRNTVVFESYQHSIDTLRRQFLHQWNEGFNSTERLQHGDETLGTSSRCAAATTRHLPLDPTWTISVDAATRSSPQDCGYGATGYVVQRAGGFLVSATGQVFRFIQDPLVLEMLAIRQALFVAEIRAPEVILILSDSAESVRLLHSDVEDIRMGQLLQECRLLYRSLPVVTISHISRLDNSAAHLVAREALNYPNSDHLLSLSYCLPPS
ncbi:hypothetical protein LINGRAHAP2_LOCUS24991 [Linum grandiflorum]